MSKLSSVSKIYPSRIIVGLAMIVASIGLSSAVVPTNAAAEDETPDLSQFEFEHVSCRGGPYEIRIVINGVKKNEGLVTADLYPNNQETFLRGRGRIELARYAAKAPVTKFCLTAPGPGLFAIGIYHDQNANKSFDKTGIGLPAEPWGLSNNPRGLFGPPKIEKALFQVTEDGATLAIKLN